jgi:hypothetical protein
VVHRKFLNIPGCHASRLITICSIDCFTIVLAGQAPIKPPSEAPNWCAPGLAELPPAQVVFATDYPQAVRHVDEVVAYVKAVGGLGSGARKILDGANAEKLIPNLEERLAGVQLNAGNGVLQLAEEQGAAISTPVDESQPVMQQQQIQPKKDTTNK